LNLYAAIDFDMKDSYYNNVNYHVFLLNIE